MKLLLHVGDFEVARVVLTGVKSFFKFAGQFGTTPARVHTILFLILVVDETSEEGYFCPRADNVRLQRGWNSLSEFLIQSSAVHWSLAEISWRVDDE